MMSQEDRIPVSTFSMKGLPKQTTPLFNQSQNSPKEKIPRRSWKEYVCEIAKPLVVQYLGFNGRKLETATAKFCLPPHLLALKPYLKRSGRFILAESEGVKKAVEELLVYRVFAKRARAISELYARPSLERITLAVLREEECLQGKTLEERARDFLGRFETDAEIQNSYSQGKYSVQDLPEIEQFVRARIRNINGVREPTRKKSNEPVYTLADISERLEIELETLKNHLSVPEKKKLLGELFFYLERNVEKIGYKDSAVKAFAKNIGVSVSS